MPVANARRKERPQSGIFHRVGQAARLQADWTGFDQKKRPNERLAGARHPMPTNKNGFLGTPGELTLPAEVIHDAHKQGGVAILVNCVTLPAEMSQHDKALANYMHPPQGGGSRGE